MTWTDAHDAAWQAGHRPEPRVCPDSSSSGETLEQSGQSAMKGGRCGVLVQYRNARDGQLRKLVWKPCRVRSCTYCGPWMRREKQRRYQAKLDGYPLWLVVVADDRWPTLARRLKRHGAEHLRIPAAGATSAILTTEPIGEQVTDLAATLAELLDAQPLDPRRVASSRGWALSGGGGGGDDDQDDDDQGPEWIPEGLVTAGADHAVELARELGVYLGPVATSGPGQAWLLRFPADDPMTWRRWKRWAGLVQDLPRRRKRQLAAA